METKGVPESSHALLLFHFGVPNRVSRTMTVGQPILRSQPAPAIPAVLALLYSRLMLGAPGPGGTGIGIVVRYVPEEVTWLAASGRATSAGDPGQASCPPVVVLALGVVDNRVLGVRGG